MFNFLCRNEPAFTNLERDYVTADPESNKILPGAPKLLSEGG
jgi:hypothetical protein